jgi:superfamily II DNA or RNA helicase
MMGQGKEKGSFYKNEFKRTINGLRTGKVQIGVGTIQKTGTGHDIPQIDRGFILAPLAGNKQLFEQVLGRFRRICRGKTEAAVYYFWDQLCYPNDKRIISKRYKQTFVWVDKEFLPT